MTRWARGGNANKKKINDASSWEELKQQCGKNTNKTDKRQTNQNLDRDSQKHRQGQASQSTSSKILHGQKHKKKYVKTLKTDKAKTASRESLNSATQSETVKELTHAGYSSKSIVDVLLEADIEKHADKQGGVSGETASEKGTSNQDYGSLEVFQKKEKRSEDRRLKRQKSKADKMVCFHCRQPGHGVADCPQTQDDMEHGTGICFRCGSTEHDVSKCTARVDTRQGEFPYAKCFICQQTGHLSNSCPDNPRGLYPEGGACKECGSVEHRWWNCPIKKPVKGVNVSVCAPLVDKRSHTSADEEPAFLKRPRVTVAKKAGPKVVFF